MMRLAFARESTRPLQTHSTLLKFRNGASGTFCSTLAGTCRTLQGNLGVPNRVRFFGPIILNKCLSHTSSNNFNAGGKNKPEFEVPKEEGGRKGPGFPPEPVPMAKRIKIVAAVLLAWGGIYFFAKYMKGRKKVEERAEQISQIDIGVSDYELIDHNGETRTKKDFMGQWLLLYFGFTHCPDICPEELEKMAEIIDFVDEDKSIPDLLPVFISVDPERDNPEVVKKYIEEFHKKFVGLTGTKEQIKQAAKSFRVYFSAGPRDEDNDYIVDHTIVMYLMNPMGKFVDYYGSRGTPTEKIVDSIKQNMKNYAKLHGR